MTARARTRQQLQHQALSLHSIHTTPKLAARAGGAAGGSGEHGDSEESSTRGNSHVKNATISAGDEEYAAPPRTVSMTDTDKPDVMDLVSTPDTRHGAIVALV